MSFKLARQLIREKRYRAARVLLEEMDDPKAKTWLKKLDEVVPLADFPDVPLRKTEKRGCYQKVRFVFLASIAILVVCSLLTIYIADSDNPKRIARRVTHDSNAIAKVTETHIAIFFDFKSLETARSDALSMFPDMLCQLREAGYTEYDYFYFEGSINRYGYAEVGIWVELSPQEINDYPCDGQGQMNFEIRPYVP